MLRSGTVSLFSPHMIASQQHRHLLLQFLLSDLFRAQEAFEMGQSTEEILRQEPYFFPYDWGNKMGHLNKVKEHALLLRGSFPKQLKTVRLIERRIFSWMKEGISLDSFPGQFQKVYSALEPLIRLCKEDENLTLFLLKHKAVVDRAMGQNHLYRFLSQLHQNRLEILEEILCNRYHRRGFFSLIPECKLLFAELLSWAHEGKVQDIPNGVHPSK